jgi:predicted DNA-binding transcriptional regulator AlpA
MQENPDPDYITVEAACAIIGGNKPISFATYYRGVKAGRFPKPEHITAQLVRIRRAKLIEALNNGGAS